MPDVILVPTDGSPEAQHALDVAIPLAAAGGQAIALLTARDPEADEAVSEEDLRAHLEALAQSRCDPGGIAWSVQIAAATPSQAILGAAEADEVQFIVMTTHGRSGFQRWRLGSVADRVVHTATKPVILVRPHEDVVVSERISNVLVPLDGSALGNLALEPATRIARASGARITLVRAVSGVVPALALPLDGYYLEADEAAEAQAAEELREVGRGIRDLEVEILVMTGRPDPVIGEAAEDADLIVMASHGRGGLVRFALGSVADAVIRHAGRPVMIVPAGDRAEA